MVEGSPVTHGGELLGFVKKEYQLANLVEVILAYEPSNQIDLKALGGALSKVSGHRKGPPPEATELLDADSVLVSRALANSIALPLIKPIIKTIVPSELFKPISGTEYILEIDAPGKDLTLAVEDRLAGTPGLAGEWFAGKIDGIIIRNMKNEAIEVPVKTGMMAQSSERRGRECITVFDFNMGFKTFKALVESNIPIIYGDVLLLDGTIDEKRFLIRTKLMFLIRSREMWVFN